MLSILPNQLPSRLEAINHSFFSASPKDALSSLHSLISELQKGSLEEVVGEIYLCRLLIRSGMFKDAHVLVQRLSSRLEKSLESGQIREWEVCQMEVALMKSKVLFKSMFLEAALQNAKATLKACVHLRS